MLQLFSNPNEFSSYRMRSGWSRAHHSRVESEGAMVTGVEVATVHRSRASEPPCAGILEGAKSVQAETGC
jgi:hypothetical protein